MIFNKELELIDLFCEFLDKFKFQYKRELRKRSYHNDGYVDIAVRIGDLFLGIEAKLNSFQAVVGQASANCVFFDRSYVLYPRYPRSKLLEEMKGWGVGLIYYDQKSKHFKTAFGSRKSQYKRDYRNYVKRNWDENRCGRKFTVGEIPSHYTNDMIKALECTYDWTKKKEIIVIKKDPNTLEEWLS